jgi:hypothetical protein
MWKNAAVLSGVAYLCAGCAANYVDVAVDEPHATITFQRNLEGVKAVNNEPFQGYRLMDSPQCDNARTVASFSFDGEYIATARVPVGRKLHFSMHSVPNRNIHGPWCWSYLGFEAEVGREYVVMHESCSPKVYDTTDDEWRPVEDLDIVDAFECPKN